MTSLFIQRRRTLAAIAALGLTKLSLAQDSAPLRADYQNFISAMGAKHGLDITLLNQAFHGVKVSATAIRLMDAPVRAPAKWFEYRPRLVSDDRVKLGLKFWEDNRLALQKAEVQYGVPAEIILAIIGVETMFGRNIGSFRVFDALVTLAFDYPRRADFFRDELEQFLLLCQEQKRDFTAPKGSFAGAMGLPQFMPSSYRKFAIAADGQQTHADLWNKPEDVILSVGNYFQSFGWKFGAPVMWQVELLDSTVAQEFDGGLTPKKPYADWAPRVRATSLTQAPKLSPETEVGLILLEEPDRPTYWMVAENFYVITRYNRSRLYASAVWNLAKQLKDGHRNRSDSSPVEPVPKPAKPVKRIHSQKYKHKRTAH